MAERLLVADSWRVDAGHVVGLAAHRRRFEAAVAAVDRPDVDRPDVDRPDVDWPAFWASVASALPAHGSWFPRVELSDDGRLGLRVRRAPPRRATTALRWDGHPDPRAAPRTKGPDLPLLGARRAAAVAAGGDCALLTSPSGAVREAATGSLLWWEDDVLCSPDDPEVLPGVTAGLVLDHARATGVPTDRRSRRPEDLAGREVWFTSALHGVTGVTSLVLAGRPGLVPVDVAPPDRAAWWHTVWRSWAEPGAR